MDIKSFLRTGTVLASVAHTIQNQTLYFGSEIKSLLAPPGVTAQISPTSLAQVLTYWSVQTPGTILKVYELPPAHWMIVDNGEITIQRYWQMDFPTESNRQSDIDWQEEFEDLLINATLIRLRADVPVGAYLSGGLDSSTTTALIRKHVQTRLETYSIAFSDPLFDESPYQRKMAEHLGTQHHIVYCTHADIGRTLPQVIWHTETPILRTAPVPMFMLSRLVHTDGFKVVVTGEGADEFLAGYDIFKEMMVRRFWARDPQSTLRPMLLKNYIRIFPESNQSGWAYLNAFFRKGLSQTEDPGIPTRSAGATPAALPASWFILPQASPTIHLRKSFRKIFHLGSTGAGTIPGNHHFFIPYLLSSQGDRVAMANSVEGRFPFLDYRLVEFCNRLPPSQAVWLAREIPAAESCRLAAAGNLAAGQKTIPAPIQKSFFQPSHPIMSGNCCRQPFIQQSGLFHPGMVAQLVRKAESGAELSEVEEMGLVGILSTQLVHTLFVQSFRRHNAAIASDRPLKRIINQKEGNHE